MRRGFYFQSTGCNRMNHRGDLLLFFGSAGIEERESFAGHSFYTLLCHSTIYVVQ